MFDRVKTDMDFGSRELEVLKFWKENKIFEESIKLREGAEVFTFYDGPPTANGKPHIGHVITRAVKDLIPRYKTMKGYKVLRKAGWDTHGLPVELEVEKALGINGKPEIEKYGIEPFIKQCKESVWKYKTDWEAMSDRVGFWADMESPYVTYDNNYIESVWWALKQIWDKGLLYKGHKIVPYCPRCGTALSSHEVAQGYKDVKEASVYAKFKVKDKDEYLLAWTTTPWTLPSNVALAVNANEQYARVNCQGQTYIMAEALVETVLKKGFEITDRFPGAELAGIEYEDLFDFFPEPFYTTELKCRYVVCDDYVTLTDGTGIVHIAPAFGEDDARIGRTNNLPFIQLVNEQGLLVESVKPWAGMFVKDADQAIIEALKQGGKLLYAADYEHNYPFCWRCDTALLYYARDTWFINVTALKDKLIENNNTVNWMPDNVRTGRFGNFLENLIDWGISRERYWGTPLPIWECSCGHREAVGSIEQLRNMSGEALPEIELHKPYIDRVHLNCPKCSGKMKRVSEVIDCWFDSGAMPFAQWHYPFENKEIFEQNFPADFISEAVDQTRGWFYSLIAISTLLFEKSPYKNVIVLGHVQDKDGQKMSKHKGNVIDPWTVLDKQGADATRWYFYSNSAPWLPNRFSPEAVNEAQRKYMGTVWNTYAFFVLYANIDGFDPDAFGITPDKVKLFGQTSPMDRWILSKLTTLTDFVDKSLDRYEITEAARALNDFADELSNWYVRRCRERFWAKDMDDDKKNAYSTLYHVLVTLSKLSAPFLPFMSESIYRNLVKNAKSVHLESFPVAEQGLVDKDLERDMDLVKRIVVLGRAARNEANIKNRQPLSRICVKSEQPLDDIYTAIIADELNVKAVEFVTDTDVFVAYKYKPQLKVLGKKYGKLIPQIGEYLANADGNKLHGIFVSGETVSFEIDAQTITLGAEDVLEEAGRAEGYVSAEDRGLVAVLDTQLNEALIEEGFVREIISKVQTMRKEAGFEVTDKIRLGSNGNDVVADVIKRNETEIKDEVLATEIVTDGALSDTAYTKEWSINGEQVTLSVQKTEG